MPWRRRLVGSGCLAAVTFLTLPSAVAPHALVLESVPKPGEVLTSPPERISLRFNSRIELALSTLSVTSSKGRTLLLSRSSENGAPDRFVIPLENLVPDVYLVRWKVLSADGHLTEGVFRFTVASSR